MKKLILKLTLIAVAFVSQAEQRTYQRVYDGTLFVPAWTNASPTNAVVATASKTFNVNTPNTIEWGFIERIVLDNRTKVGSGDVTVSIVDLGHVIPLFTTTLSNDLYSVSVLLGGTNAAPYSAKDLRITAVHSAGTNFTPRVEYGYRVYMR